MVVSSDRLLLLSTTYGSAWRGERDTEIPVTKSVRVNRRTLPNIHIFLVVTA